jgi:hypothetical protein
MACSLLIVLMMAVSTSETLVNVYQMSLCYNPEDGHVHTHRLDIVKSHKIIQSRDQVKEGLV